ncbi:hypothetical protein RISK_002885 [Rhodopirellula islandica]|uniref:Uncharacterized protein n=1 Tax=Rhodopirellula islandica TaxID=595434 RepID=A0A0J1BEV9_RHOIS|nr:hypothetical protein RISK_002885 [Rhodopirellula islandica]
MFQSIGVVARWDLAYRSIGMIARWNLAYVGWLLSSSGVRLD